MPQVNVIKVKENETGKNEIFQEIRDLGERVRERAFELFEHRGCKSDHKLEDWLRAEQELIWSPQSELLEKDGTFTLRLSTPGFKADEVNVTALPGVLVVKAEAHHEREETTGKVHFSEFGQKTLFRRYPLPEPIALDKVTASLDNGVLQVTAPKALPAVIVPKSAAA
jgi:HSP20 family protein